MNYQKMIQQNPEQFLRKMEVAKQTEQAMYKVAKQWAQKNGNFVSADGTVTYSKRTRSDTYISVKETIASLKRMGIQPEKVAQLKFTQQAFNAVLGEEMAQKVLQQLARDGCFKKFTTQYWRLQIK